jgi:uncharacterized protein YkwD
MTSPRRGIVPARQAVTPVLIALALTLGVTGCDPAASDDEVTVVTDSSQAPWPWETSPPTPTSAESATVTPTATPTPTETATRTPTPTPTPTSEPPEPEPEPEPKPEPTPTEAATPPPPPAGGPITAREAEVVELTNKKRAKDGCDTPLRVDDRLVAAAQGHSADMATRNYFSHTSPEGDGPGERTAAQGYPQWSGENIALGYPTPEAVVAGWMESPGHRANILNCDSVAIGVGAADSDRGIYWTQVFGSV